MSAKPARTLITVVMNILVFVAILLTIRLVVMFFGSIASMQWAESFVAITDLVVIPFGAEPIKTPYGGVFDVNAAITVVALLLAEWVLSLARSRS